VTGEIFLLGSVMFVAWLPAFFRGSTGVFDYVVILPYARYAFPAIVPTLLLFSSGFLEALRSFQSYFGLPERLPQLAFLAMLGGLDAYAIYSFGGKFYPWIMNTGYLTFFILLMGMIYFIFWKVTCLGDHSVD